MGKLIYALAAFGALAWSDPAWAVLQETTITLTDHGKPLPEATITLNRLTDSQPPPQPKTEKTDDSGKVVLVHDKEDKKSDSTIELIVTTSEGEHPDAACGLEGAADERIDRCRSPVGASRGVGSGG